MTLTRSLLTSAAAALGLLSFVSASQASSHRAAESTSVIQSSYRVTNGNTVAAPKARHIRHARKHHHHHRHARACGIFEPHPNGYCPNYTGPIYHRADISFAGVEDYAEVPEGYGPPYMVPRYYRAGYSYGWPPHNDGRRLHPYHRHMWY